MKFTLLLIFSFFTVAASGQEVLTKNKKSTTTILITPLGDLINDNKSSIYFKFPMPSKTGKEIKFRIGSEFLNSINVESSPGEKIKSNSINLKAGIEIYKKLGEKFSTYYGPEISIESHTISEVELTPSNNSIFSTNSINGKFSNSIEESTLNITSVIGVIGFRYAITEHINVGIESAIGIGFFKTDTKYNFLDDQRVEGEIVDIVVNRFISLGYSF